MNNSQEISLKDLTKYVLAHRKNQEAWDKYISRPRPNATIILADIPLEEQQQIFEDLLCKTK